VRSLAAKSFEIIVIAFGFFSLVKLFLLGRNHMLLLIVQITFWKYLPTNGCCLETIIG
jgi:hypothetical protein